MAAKLDGPVLRLCWSDTDRWPWLAPLAAGGLVLASGLAVFGLPPIDVHPPFHYLGVMDLLCGLTRGTVAFVRADVAGAWRYNPASLFVVPAAVAAVLRWAAGRQRRRWLDVAVNRRRRVAAMVSALVAVLEVNQQLHAGLLR